jgi:hypothetical protein
MIVVVAPVKVAMKKERMPMKGQIIMIGNKSNKEKNFASNYLNFQILESEFILNQS